MYRPEKGETIIVLGETIDGTKWTVGRVLEVKENKYKVETENPVIEHDSVEVHPEDIHEMTDRNYDEYVN